MDDELPQILGNFCHSPDQTVTVDSSMSFPDLVQVNCIVCGNLFLPELDGNEQSDSICVCGACKVIFLENLESGTRFNPQRRSRRRRRRRRARYNPSLDSMEDLAYQIPQFTNPVRQSEENAILSASEQECQQDNDSVYSNLFSSSHTTPNRSDMLQRLYSDYDSKGFGAPFDSSVFGETDSNFSFGGYGTIPGDSDAISYSAYGGGSDVSLDDQVYISREVVIQAETDPNNIQSDSDFNPLHPGQTADAWNSDDQDGGDWIEEVVENVETVVFSDEYSGLDRNASPLNWLIEAHYSEFVGANAPRGRRDNEHAGITNIFSRLEEFALNNIARNATVNMDTEDLVVLQHILAEADDYRRGAPPASAPIVESLPRFLIREEHEKNGEILCAICKDPLSINSEVIQLPCSHLYHSSCILPWLNSRNSCPVCRYELPTDDQDYEDSKRTVDHISTNQLQETNFLEDDSSDSGNDLVAAEYLVIGGVTDVNRMNRYDNTSREDRGGSWFFLRAAPLISLAGIALIMWLGSPLTEGSRCMPRRQVQARVLRSGEASTGTGSRRRWWSLFRR